MIICTSETIRCSQLYRHYGKTRPASFVCRSLLIECFLSRDCDVNIRKRKTGWDCRGKEINTNMLWFKAIFNSNVSCVTDSACFVITFSFKVAYPTYILDEYILNDECLSIKLAIISSVMDKNSPDVLRCLYMFSLHNTVVFNFLIYVMLPFCEYLQISNGKFDRRDFASHST